MNTQLKLMATENNLMITYLNPYGFRYSLGLYVSREGLVVWSDLIKARVRVEPLDEGEHRLVRVIMEKAREKLREPKVLDPVESVLLFDMQPSDFVAMVRMQPKLALMILAEGLGLGLKDMWEALTYEGCPGDQEG